jgi:tRNA dimethylallyltransferase
MRAHGVPGLIGYFDGIQSLEQAIAKGQQDTRHYAKRQFTWFRHQLGDWPRIAPEGALDALMRALGR